MSVNYRNEPVALRIRNPETNTQANGAAGDLSGFTNQTLTVLMIASTASPLSIRGR